MAGLLAVPLSANKLFSSHSFWMNDYCHAGRSRLRPFTILNFSKPIPPHTDQKLFTLCPFHASNAEGKRRLGHLPLGEKQFEPFFAGECPRKTALKKFPAPGGGEIRVCHRPTDKGLVLGNQYKIRYSVTFVGQNSSSYPSVNRPETGLQNTQIKVKIGNY